jgi:hypothetical protein
MHRGQGLSPRREPHERHGEKGGEGQPDLSGPTQLPRQRWRRPGRSPPQAGDPGGAGNDIAGRRSTGSAHRNAHHQAAGGTALARRAQAVVTPAASTRGLGGATRQRITTPPVPRRVPGRPVTSRRYALPRRPRYAPGRARRRSRTATLVPITSPVNVQPGERLVTRTRRTPHPSDSWRPTRRARTPTHGDAAASVAAQPPRCRSPGLSVAVPTMAGGDRRQGPRLRKRSGHATAPAP